MTSSSVPIASGPVGAAASVGSPEPVAAISDRCNARLICLSRTLVLASRRLRSCGHGVGSDIPFSRLPILTTADAAPWH